MPSITAAVSEATKEGFNAIARARCTTPSRLAASLVENFVNDEGRIHTRREHSGLQLAVLGDSGGEARTEQVFVRLAPRYYAELGRLATERNWYRGTYLANLFHAHVDRKPVLCEYEIDALRQVGRQLADLGRNLNQIAKKLNASLEHAHLAKALDFEVIQMLLGLETNAVKELLRANIRGWGVGDAEA